MDKEQLRQLQADWWTLQHGWHDGRAGTVQGVAAERDDGELSVTEREIPTFEDQRSRYAGAKNAAVRERFGWRMATYQLRLNALLDRPEAAAYAPVLVGRLRRLRSKRRAARPARRQGCAAP